MRRTVTTIFASLLLSAALPASSFAAAIYVSNFAELSAAINTANLDAGSTIFLAPGTYSGGALPNILASTSFTLDPAFGAQNGAAILATTPTGSKGLLTVPDSVFDITLNVSGLTFQNASISEADGGNGAGIRFQSRGAALLNVANSMFIGNQNGILTGFGGALVDELLDVTISDSFFANNGSGTGSTHGIYIQGRSLEVTNSLFCGTNIGHDIKTRTQTTSVSGSQFYDGVAGPDPLCNVGSASYAIDMPNGGAGTLSDNQFFQGAAGDNPAHVSYGFEGVAYAANSLVVDGNSFNSSINGTGIQQPTCITPVQLSDNTFTPNLQPVSPPGCFVNVEGPVDPVPVPEPATLALFGAALVGLGMWRVRRRVKA